MILSIFCLQIDIPILKPENALSISYLNKLWQIKKASLNSPDLPFHYWNVSFEGCLRPTFYCQPNQGLTKAQCHLTNALKYLGF